MRTGRKSNWLLVAVLLIVLTLAVIYARYSQRLTTSVPNISPSSKHLKLPDSSVTAGRTSSQDLKAEKNSIEMTSTDKSNSPAATFSRIDESVVGQVFQVSDSVKEGCKSDTIECPLVMASVARMAKEPRDIDWAPRMEEKLQAAVDMQGPGKYVIRNVECRTSTCILEVEVHAPEPFVARYDDVIFSSLRPNALTISAPEYDSSGARFSVELMDFARR
jgi:hypothetical protein